MARRKISMVEVDEILYRWLKGISERKIAHSLGISRNTVKKIVSKAKAAGLKRTSEQAEAEEKLGTLLNSLYDKKKSQGQAEVYIAARHEQIMSWLSAPHMTVNQMVRLFKEQGDAVSETSLRRYIRKHIPSLPSSTVHLQTIPGNQAQVDFGYVGLMKDPVSQKMRKAYAFIMILSHSRHRFVRFVFKQDSQSWIDCHIRAFHFFGGVPLTVMIDNLKSGITTADFYDPILNRTYGELERHYGFVCDPTKVRTPEHKGKIERSVTIVRQQVIAGRCFKDIEEANVYALQWCRHEIGTRASRTTGQAPWEKFIKEEKAFLKPLPSHDYEYASWQELKVHRDHHIVFEGSFYSVQTQYIGTMVWVRASQRMVDIYINHQKIKKHIRASNRGQWVTDPQDYPKGAKAFLEKDRAYCLEQGKLTGPSTHQFLSQVLEKPGLVNQRRAQVILRLAEKYGAQRLEAACQRAISFENYTYRSLKGILDQGLDGRPLQEDQTAKMTLPKQTSYLRGQHEFHPAYQGGSL